MMKSYIFGGKLEIALSISKDTKVISL